MSKYVDIPAIMQLIGGIYLDINLLDNDEYFFCEEDFTEEFHRILFGSMFNIHALGAHSIDIKTIEDYLEQRPSSFAIYKTNKGREYLQKLEENVQLATFQYYYNRVKKMTLMRMYNNIGMDLSWLYDPDNILNIKKKQAQEDWLDNTSLEEIAEIIDKKLFDIRVKYVDNAGDNAESAGEGVLELLENLKKTPEIGYPLYGPLINTITRGARLKKLYLRSAATGVGKTRSMIADACSIAVDELFDSNKGQWVPNGTAEPTLFITTEQERDEIQTMLIAFISDVDEEHLLTGEYQPGEWERVLKAAEILKRAPLYIQMLPDFSLKDIENTIKRGIREYDVKYVFLDYLHTSMKILEEVTKRSGGVRLREDNILFMIAIRLKDLCNQYGVFIMTATQLNGDYVSAKQYDQNLLRGAKAIADKIDMGAVLLETNQDDIIALDKIIKEGHFEEPTVKLSIYKNRRGRYKNILLWCKANRGTCKIIPMFATDYQYRFIPIDDVVINVQRESAF